MEPPLILLPGHTRLIRAFFTDVYVNLVLKSNSALSVAGRGKLLGSDVSYSRAL